MKSNLLWLIVAVAILGCAQFWYEASKNRLEIDPHAAEEIEQAKRQQEWGTVHDAPKCHP